MAMASRLFQWVIRDWWIAVSGGLLVLLLVLHLTSLRYKEVTYDEPYHYQYGYRVLEAMPLRVPALFSSKMPFSSLNAITSECLAIFEKTFGFSLDTSWNGQIKRGRYATDRVPADWDRTRRGSKKGALLYDHKAH